MHLKQGFGSNPQQYNIVSQIFSLVTSGPSPFSLLLHQLCLQHPLLQLNPNISIDVKVQHALKKSDAALETLNRAIGIDPKNPLCKFHRASILFANDKYKVRHLFLPLCHILKALNICEKHTSPSRRALAFRGPHVTWRVSRRKLSGNGLKLSWSTN